VKPVEQEECDVVYIYVVLTSKENMKTINGFSLSHENELGFRAMIFET
jgi:hypothetical protein